jgi:hypothetical protein
MFDAHDGIDHLVEDMRWLIKAAPGRYPEMTKTLTALSVPHSALPRRQLDDQQRRQSLRRLDDILETLEQLNLHDRTELPDHAAERLVMLGIREPHSIPIPQLIEHVWAMQQPYLITIVVERRRRQRRKMGAAFLDGDQAYHQALGTGWFRR